MLSKKRKLPTASWFSVSVARRVLPVILLFAFAFGCQSGSKRASGSKDVQKPTPVENSLEQQGKPYVVMVSIDGYRFDYSDLYHPIALDQIRAGGVQAEGLIPAYPSKTFPNHYSLVTGLYPEHHGIVSNEFYDPNREQTYALADRKQVEDGSWYFGFPIWIVVQAQKMVAASYFWVGSDAAIQGQHPRYWFDYRAKTPDSERVAQVLAWLKLPEKDRPHFITLYLSEVDTAGHRHGTHSLELKNAVLEADHAIEKLREGLKSTGLPVNLIVVSDHGMDDVDAKKTEYLDDYADLSFFEVVGSGPQVLLYLKKGADQALIRKTQSLLAKKAEHFRVYQRLQMPEELHYRASPRAGDLIVNVDEPYSVGVHTEKMKTHGGNHGWDPRESKLMQGIFYAEGPAFLARQRVPAFENVHVYPLVLHILGIEVPSPIDGEYAKIKHILKTP